jgi:hypothetical protein
MQITFYCAIPLYCTDWYQWRAAHNQVAEISSQIIEFPVKCAIINFITTENYMISFGYSTSTSQKNNLVLG